MSRPLHLFAPEPDKQPGAVVKIEGGKDDYFRVNLQVGMWKGHYRQELVMPEQGKYDVAKLKPSDRDKVAQGRPDPEETSDASKSPQ